jgi:hypothetical protein
MLIIISDHSRRLQAALPNLPFGSRIQGFIIRRG